jgi:DNA polymerase-3 subunit delta'
MREVVGHRQACALLERAALTNQVGHAYLLTGPEQIGKTTLARAFVTLLQCTGRAAVMAEPCGACLACRKIAHGNHPDVTLVEPPAGKRWLPVESIRDIVHEAGLEPYEGRWRAFILPGAERMQAAPMNALLKTLEEPPPRVLLVLTSAEPEVLLPTLVSRCQQVPIHPLTHHEVAQALVERWGVDQTEAQELAGLAGGRLGWAVNAHALPELRQERAALIEQVIALAQARRGTRLRLVAALAGDAESARVAVDVWALWWRDVLLGALGADQLLSTASEGGTVARRLGRAIGPEAAEAFLRRLLTARRQLDQNANPRLALEVLALDMPVPGAAKGER